MLGIIIFYSYLYNVGQGDQISSTQNTTTMEEEQIMDARLHKTTVKCSACGAENSIKWEKKEISIDDKQGSYKDLTFNFCEECGDVTNVEFS